MRAHVAGEPAVIRAWDGATWVAIGGVPSATPGTDPDTLTTLRHVTDNAAWFRISEVAGPTGRHAVTSHTVRTPATALRLAWGSPLGSTLTGRAGIIVRGITHWVTWGGAQQVTLHGEARVSDPVPDVVTEAGDTIHTVWEAAPGSDLATRDMRMPTAIRRYGDGPFTGVVGSMSETALSGAPQGIYGLTVPEWDRSVALVGDSFAEVGWGRLALDAVGVAWSDLGQWGESTPLGLPSYRLPATEGVPYSAIITYYGGNNSRDPLADQQAAHIAHWRALAATGARVAAMTLHPYTSSTDSWTTLAGQTPVPERRNADRIARNNWLRDGAPLDTSTWEPYPVGSTAPGAVRVGEPGHPVTYPVFDQADATETARDSGIWRVDGGAWTVDGTHLTPHGSAMLQPYFEAWLREHVI